MTDARAMRVRPELRRCNWGLTLVAVVLLVLALSGTDVRAIASVPVSFFSPLSDSFLIGLRVFFSFMPGSKPPPWIMKFGMTRWKIVPS